MTPVTSHLRPNTHHPARPVTWRLKAGPGLVRVAGEAALRCRRWAPAGLDGDQRGRPAPNAAERCRLDGNQRAVGQGGSPLVCLRLAAHESEDRLQSGGGECRPSRLPHQLSVFALPPRHKAAPPPRCRVCRGWRPFSASRIDLKCLSAKTGLPFSASRIRHAARQSASLSSRIHHARLRPRRWCGRVARLHRPRVPA